MGKQVRHAVARSTGATTLARKVGDEWSVACLSHKAATTVASRGQAWRTAAQPESFCSKCAPIAKGKADRVTGDKVAIPTPRRNGKKAATKRQPAKKLATRKASGR